MFPKLTGKQLGFLCQLVHFVYTTNLLPETFTIEPAPYEHIYIGPTKHSNRIYYYYPGAMDSLVTLLDYGFLQKVFDGGIEKFRITISGRLTGRWDNPNTNALD